MITNRNSSPRTSPLSIRGNDVTRLSDLAIALVGITLSSPLFLAIALAVRCDSPGPVFFRQTRVGKGGTLFQIHKFRTMRLVDSGPAITMPLDPRITRVGKVLRSSKLDELPQLIDVVFGNMAIVGPRPEVPQYVDLWPQDLRSRILSVRPGITDPVSVMLRNETHLLGNSTDPESTYVQILLPSKARAYAQYVEAKSFRGDLRVIFRTIRAVLLPQRIEVIDSFFESSDSEESRGGMS